MQCCSLGSSYLMGSSVQCMFIEFFVFDHDSIPNLIFFFWLGVTFPLVALDKIISK